MKKTANDIYNLLEERYERYNRIDFISSDPISIPHLFTKKQDIEIAAFFSASIAWGTRTAIVKAANKIMEWMDYSPHDFILSANKKDIDCFKNFVYRTFNGDDCISFIRALRQIYRRYDDMEKLFMKGFERNDKNLLHAIARFRKEFFSFPHKIRTRKHFSDPLMGSAAKRMNMLLRWMVRNDGRGVDFGLWKRINPSQLTCPLDVHTSAVARKLGLLIRKQNDWKAASILTDRLRKFDPADPVKYDFALFGMGCFEKE